MNRVAIVVPNWNGDVFLGSCIESLLAQTARCTIIVVDNGSTDKSIDILQSYGDQLVVLRNKKNYGFAGGVNVGIRYAINKGFEYICLLNNDAIADTEWASRLITVAEKNMQLGIVTSRILSSNGKTIDSTGDFYTVWGLPFPRGRGEPSKEKYLASEEVFAGSGGASLYRVSMLKEIGLFDEDFFAYYEDVDISFRARIYGWKVWYSADSIVYHRISATSGRVKGFIVYQSLKNLPSVYIKNMPTRLFWKHLPKLIIAHIGLVYGSAKRGNAVPAIKGFGVSILITPKKLIQRITIQKHRAISTDDLAKIIQKDPPVDQTGMIRLKRFLG